MIKILSHRLVGNPRNWENSQHLVTLDCNLMLRNDFSCYNHNKISELKTFNKLESANSVYEI